MRTVNMSYNEIHDYVDHRRNAFWEEWTAVIVEKRGDGFLRNDGIFFDGAWGIQKRIKPNSNGVWKVPAKYV